MYSGTEEDMFFDGQPPLYKSKSSKQLRGDGGRTSLTLEIEKRPILKNKVQRIWTQKCLEDDPSPADFIRNSQRKDTLKSIKSARFRNSSLLEEVHEYSSASNIKKGKQITCLKCCMIF